MHRLLPIGAKPGCWAPKLSPSLVRALGPVRRVIQRVQYRIDDVHIEGLDNLRQVVDSGHGVMVASNHVTYPDPLVLAEAAAKVGRAFYFMTAWQVFGTSPWIKRACLQRFGCFSVDREGSDIRAFRTAVEILQERDHPLMIFPEGEMYHTNDRIMPFHDGAAAILLSAAKRSKRPVVCIPCALRYEYTEDPTSALENLMDELEQRLHWRPNTTLSLVDRVYRLAKAAIALKEIEYLGHTTEAELPERLQHLCRVILGRLEHDCELGDRSSRSVPDRVKQIRQHLVERIGEAEDDSSRVRYREQLEDVFLAVQLFSYPGEYLAELPNVERLAETLDKLEEDILSVPHATVRGRRVARIRLAEAIAVEADRKTQPSVAELTERLEQSIQQQLDLTIERQETQPLTEPIRT